MKRFSIYPFLVALLIFSLVIPANVADATKQEERTTGTLTIHKYKQEPEEVGTGVDGDGSENQPAPGTPLPGVTYEVKQTHSYNNGKWTPISENDALNTEVTTGNDGTVSIELPLGRFTIQEIDGPNDVILNTKKFTVDIPMTNKEGNDLNYHVHIYPKNETIRGSVELQKVDGDNDDNPLQGVHFDLYGPEGKVNDDPLVTDNEGKITVESLPFGEYFFKEIKTLDGYMLGDQNVKFVIDEKTHNTTQQLKVTNYKEPDVEKGIDQDAINRGEIVEYTITVTLPGDIASYQYFNVTDLLHQNLEFIEVTKQPDGFVFERNGQELKWVGTPSDLEPGEVTFSFKAKVKEDAEANKIINNKAYIDYANQYDHEGRKESKDVPLTPTAGKLIIIKKDGDTKKKLPGAEFELRQGNKVIKTGITNNDGVLVFEDLDYGDYELVEVKAPNGYSLIPNGKNITIDSKSDKIVVKNYKSGWELPKTGGIGTMLFTLVGLSFMGTALYMLYRRRRGDTV